MGAGQSIEPGERAGGAGESSRRLRCTWESAQLALPPGVTGRISLCPSPAFKPRRFRLVLSPSGITVCRCSVKIVLNEGILPMFATLLWLLQNFTKAGLKIGLLVGRENLEAAFA